MLISRLKACPLNAHSISSQLDLICLSRDEGLNRFRVRHVGVKCEYALNRTLPSPWLQIGGDKIANQESLAS